MRRLLNEMKSVCKGRKGFVLRTLLELGGKV